MTLDSRVGFKATMNVNVNISLILQISSLSITVDNVINSTRGDTSYFGRLALNTALGALLLVITPIVNSDLAKGFELNPIVQSIFGDILYVKEMDLVPSN